jgi:hypothetical protein
MPFLSHVIRYDYNIRMLLKESVWTEIIKFSAESVGRICEQINESSPSFKYMDDFYVVGRLSDSRELCSNKLVILNLLASKFYI